MHRVLIGVVTAGAVIIAGIGFAGSYTAVRELAIRQGFGNFSYLFPIGIDAGICVLLALDLLLTWIRIPFPLLRQSAWLLTAATIAFNSAAAWPDPLGVSMHGVIPVLFVVTVEAARHAIGRIADITADQHMEGVRLTRWLLSPLPTFLLWRRMKLWELRSYQQAINLEQQRLAHQTRLRSRHGRAWRRKAPAESLLPLRLTRYGIPLATITPAALASVGIEDPAIPAEQASAPAHLGDQQSDTRGEAAGPQHEQAQSERPVPAASKGAFAAYVYERDGITGADGHPITGSDLERHGAAFPAHKVGALQAQAAFDSPTRPQPADGGEPAQPDRKPRTPIVNADQQAGETEPSPAENQPPAHSPHSPTEQGSLTTPDRYYLAWMDYQAEHGHQPSAEQLSAYLAAQGLLGRGHHPISPANLRRHFLKWRIYNIWAQHRAHTTTPSLDDIAKECITHGITAQYNKPITTTYITEQTPNFERRWRALSHRHRS